MEFLGVGPGELIFILIIALIVVGPERLPVLARQAGKFLVTVRDWIQKSPDAAMILRAREEIEAELANLRSSLAEVQGVRDEVIQTAKQMTTMVNDEVISPTRAAMNEVTGSVPRSTKPNGLPLDPEVVPTAAPTTEPTLIAPNGSPLTSGELLPTTEPTLITPDGSALTNGELPPAADTAMIRPPNIALPEHSSNGTAHDVQTLQTHVAALTSELRALQAQLQERGLLAPSASNSAPPHLITPERFVPPATLAQTIDEENADVDQPVLLRD